MADPLPSPLPRSTRPAGTVVVRVPVPMLRYHQRPPESSRGPERIEGPGLPADHVLHRTPEF